MSRTDRDPPAGTLRDVVRSIGGHRRWVLVTAALGTLASSSGIALVAFSAVLISRSALLTSTASLALTIVAVRFFATARVLLRYVERVVGHLATFRLLTRLRTWFFAAAIPIAPRGLTDRRTGELLDTVLDDVDTMQDALLRVVIPPLVAAGTVIVSVTVLAASSPRSAAVLLISAALSATVVPLLMHRRSRSSESAIAQLRARSSAELLESFEGARELIAFGALDAVRDRIESFEAQADAARISLARSRALGIACATLIASGCAVVVTGLAIDEVRSGAFRGELLALIPLVALATFESTTSLLTIFDARERSSAAARRISSIADPATIITVPGGDRTPTGAGIADPVGGDLVLTDVSHAHDTGLPVLSDVSCTIPAGSVAVITGESGAGKSTLVDLLLRFDDPRGSIRLGEVELTAIDPAIARSAFAVVRQHDHIFDTTVRDNLALADPDASDAEMLEVLATAGLGEFIDALPDGLTTRTGPDGSALSGGERQRVLIARALLADRPVLILDEALEHLDRPRRSAVLDAILAHRIDRTTIIISHDELATARSTLRFELVDGALRVRV